MIKSMIIPFADGSYAQFRCIGMPLQIVFHPPDAPGATKNDPWRCKARPIACLYQSEL